MNQLNTPKIGNALTENALDHIPEAHCYLKIDGNRKDLTTHQSDFESLENDIITELEILPEQVAEFKVDYHKQFLKNWISKHHIGQSLVKFGKLEKNASQI